MHDLHGLLPRGGRKPGLSGAEAGGTRRRASAAQATGLLRQRPEILHELQALRGGLPLERAHRRHHPGRPHQVRAAAQHLAAELRAVEHRPGGFARHTVRPDRQLGRGAQTRALRDGQGDGDRPPARLPQIRPRDLHLVVPQACGRRAGRLREAGGLLPRLLRQLQQPAAGQGPDPHHERPGLRRAAARQGEVLRRGTHLQRALQAGAAPGRDEPRVDPPGATAG